MVDSQQHREQYQVAALMNEHRQAVDPLEQEKVETEASEKEDHPFEPLVALPEAAKARVQTEVLGSRGALAHLGGGRLRGTVPRHLSDGRRVQVHDGLRKRVRAHS